MYFHLANHLYFSFFREEGILLDLKMDKYFILSPEQAQNLATILNPSFINEQNKYIPIERSIMSFATELKKAGVLVEHTLPYPFLIDKKITGVSNIDWQLPLNGLDTQPFPPLIKEAFWNLIKVHMILKCRGFYQLIKIIRKRYSPYAISPPKHELQQIIEALNHACLFYPIRTKCLEWAATLTLIALKRDWKCNLVIGVQNRPFLAHAWAENEASVIADDPTLQDSLSLILREPFRSIG